MPVGDTRANDHLDSMLGSDHSSRFPGTVYFTLYYVAPDNDGGGTEASYSGFARVAITNDDTHWPDAVSRQKHNALQIDLATPDADTPEFAAWAIHGHITNDDIIVWNTFDSAFSGTEDSDFYVPAETLVIVE